MPLEEKRKHYACGQDYLTISNIPTWSEFHKGKLTMGLVERDSHSVDHDTSYSDIDYPKDLKELHFPVDSELNKKVTPLPCRYI